nr:hypothetical protein [Clostridia bacterium]
MYQAIKRYCENDKQNGLFLLDMPTGFGKTYNVIKYIYDASINEANKDKKYFFITTLKKNLPTVELEQWFKENGKADQFKEKFLFIDSNVDCAIEHLTEKVKDLIPNDIKKTDEYKEFEKGIRFLQSQDTDTKLKAFVSSIQDTLRTKTEPAFRRLLQTMLAKEYPSVDKRLYAIKTEKRWQWLGELYPAVFTKDRQIIFMSVEKFLSRNSTIVETSYVFYNSSIIENAVIFIDEFDATKETILNNIIQNGLRDRIDYVDLFLSIYGPLQTASFPAALTIPSKKRKASDYANQSLQAVIDGIKEKAEIIYDTYSLQFNHRTNVDENNSRNFLFQDHQFHSVLNGNNKYVTTTSIKTDRINAIKFTEERPELESNNIQILLGKLRGFISWFLGGVNILAINYMQRKLEEKRDGDEDFTFEYAIRSVLSLFRLNQIYIDFLTSQILISSHKAKGDIQSSEFDKTFYENGFRYYAFEDDAGHDMQSRMMMCSFQNTPEKILLRFCEKAKVIGISATATIDTVVGNFDLDYLKAKMQSSYVEMSDEDYNRLSRNFEETQCGYNQVNIHTELLGDTDYNSYGIKSWQRVFDDREIAEEAYNIVQRKRSDNENNYNSERYLRITEAYKQFLCHADIKSFLCVLTKHPQFKDSTLDLNTIYDLFELTAKVFQPGFDARKSVVKLDGDEFDQKKNDVTRRLERGEKLFVISVYQTIGAGQNLQYKAPATIIKSLIKVNDRDSGEKDYDAIYLDKPTNLLVNFIQGQSVEEDQFAKALFQYEFLQENAEISIDESVKSIKNAFRAFMSNGSAKGEYVSNQRDCKSIRMLATRYIIQAIGRICRTNLKQKDIYVFADSRIAESLDVSVVEKRIVNREFSALLGRISQVHYKSPEERSLEAKAALTSIRVNKDIRNMIEEDWNDKSIEKWQVLRDLVLRYPTLSHEEVSRNFVAYNYYVEMPKKANRIYYNQEEDFNKISVGFVKASEYKYTLSAEGAKLIQLMSFPDIKQYFKSAGYATEFAENDFIMSPPLWNNIYKGALGEVVGRYLFNKILSVKLDDITDPEIFELFDFKVRSSSVFLDFKDWQESTDSNWDKQIRKITEKANKCGCKCAIIANILTANSRYSVRESTENGVHILIVPALLLESTHDVYTDAWKKIKECIEKYGDSDQ